MGVASETLFRLRTECKSVRAGVFRATPTRLGDWGFEVVQVTRKPRPGGTD